MPADAPGRRLKVLASGLQQLGIACEKTSGELSADATPPVAEETPGWASCLSTLNSAAGSAGADLGRVGTRIGTRGTDYSKAALLYTNTDEANAGKLRGLKH
jgi:hypothetical protein